MFCRWRNTNTAKIKFKNSPLAMALERARVLDSLEEGCGLAAAVGFDTEQAPLASLRKVDDISISGTRW